MRLPFLGHVINNDGILVDPQKIEVIVNWPTSTNITEVRSLMGLVKVSEVYQGLFEDYCTIDSTNSKRRTV